MLRARSQAETPSGPTSARGSIGSARIWDEATRAARRREAVELAPVAGSDPAAAPLAARLIPLVFQAVQSALDERLPGAEPGQRVELALELQARILAWLALATPSAAGAQVPAPEPAPSRAEVTVGVGPALEAAPPNAPDPEPPGGALGRRLQERLLGIGGPALERADFRQRLILLVLRSIQAAAPAQPASPEEAEQLDLLRRRLSKLERALEEARAALAKVSTLESVDPGIASIYRTVQGLDANDPRSGGKRQVLELLFQANLEFQKSR